MQKRSLQDRRLVKTGTPGIYKRGGSYVVIFRDPNGRQRKRSARTLAEARDLKATLTADVRRGEYRQLSRVTFADYADEWCRTYHGRTSRGVRPHTLRDYTRILRQDAVPYFKRTQLAAIEPRHIKEFAATFAGRGLTPNTVRNKVAPVKALFATAFEEGLIRTNPAAGLRIAARHLEDETGEQHVKALNENELRAVLDEAPDQWRLLFAFLAQTGLRIGEAVALTWNDIDLGRKRVHVRRRLYRGQFDAPKSRYGRRQVPLSEGLARALWRSRGTAGDDAPVFASRANTHLTPSNVFRVFKPAAARAGVPWAGLHTLRHTCATMLFRHGLNAKQVQAWLGHHSPAFTLATYVHLLPDDLPEPSFFDLGSTAIKGYACATLATELRRDRQVPKTREAPASSSAMP